MRAFEEADPNAAFLLAADRRQATEEAAAEADFSGFLQRRAEYLIGVLERSLARLPRLLALSGLRIGAVWIVVPALAFGLASNLLGPEKHVNVVANPLAALILWNLVAYVALLVVYLRAGTRTAGSATAGAPTASLASYLAARLGRLRGDDTGRNQVVVSATARYLESWNRDAAPLLTARVKRALHLGALTMVLGALAGMYLRGLLFEYRATWESTFLTAGGVRGFLEVFLLPGTLLTGIPIPDVAAIDATSSPAGSGPAADWIHLYAATTAVVVLLPRALLALGAGARARSLARSLEVDTAPAYFRRLRASGRGDETAVTVLPYSYTLRAAHADALKALLFDVLGARARIAAAEPLDYGAPLPDPGPVAGGAAPIMAVVFNLAQTPEGEVHGRFLEELKASAVEGGRCLALVDSAGWRERAGEAGSFERRVEEHRRTWDRLARDVGLTLVHVDLDRPLPDDLLGRADAALWPAGSAVARNGTTG